MDQRFRVAVTLISGMLLIAGLWFFARTISSLTGYSIGAARFDNFAKCLTDKNALLYTSDLGCEGCTQQRVIFRNSYQYLTVINCRTEMEKCNDLEIKYGPVWIINGVRYFGVYGVPRLAEITGCDV